MCRLIAQSNRDPCDHEECRNRGCVLKPIPHRNSPLDFRQNDQFSVKSFPKVIETPQPAFPSHILSFNQQLTCSQIASKPQIQQLPSITPVFVGPVQQIQAEQKQAYDSNSMMAALNLLVNQQKIMQEMQEKEDRVEKTLLFLLNEVKLLRAGQQIPNTPNCKAPGNQLSELATSETLLNMLYPKGTNEFLYSLKVSGDFPHLLYRERYFRLTLELVDLRTGVRVSNPNKLRVSFALYTSENPPKPIIVNTSGNKVFKGASEVELEGGVAEFDKVQINEVSSHFLNGWVFLVAYPKFTAETAQSMSFLASYSGGLFIDPSRIRPMILEKLVVKAKKLKND